MIQDSLRKNKTSSPQNNSFPVGLSYSPYFKKRSVSKNPEYISCAKVIEKQFYEVSKGGSWVSISDNTIDPHTTVDDKEYVARGCISKFSRKSRNRLLQLVSKIDKSKVDPNTVLFITLTAPSVGWLNVSGSKWKKRLNNFLTQLRQKFKYHNSFCGIWRQEFQRRGSPHYHLVTYNVPYIDMDWISRKWNKICCKDLSFKEQQKHLSAGTQVQVAREWGSVNDYFSKTMAYVSKDDSWKLEEGLDARVLDYMKTFGRHWGVINKSNLDKLISVVVGEFNSKKQFHQVKRTFRKYLQSIKRRKLKGNHNKSVAKKLDRVYKENHRIKKQHVFMDYDLFAQLLILYDNDITPYVDPFLSRLSVLE